MQSNEFFYGGASHFQNCERYTSGMKSYIYIIFNCASCERHNIDDDPWSVSENVNGRIWVLWTPNRSEPLETLYIRMQLLYTVHNIMQ